MRAEIVRSDVCPIAAAAVIGEAVTAAVLADRMTVKFGGDSLREIKDNLSRYVEHVRDF
jgi:chorismate synthase